MPRVFLLVLILLSVLVGCSAVRAEEAPPPGDSVSVVAPAVVAPATQPVVAPAAVPDPGADPIGYAQSTVSAAKAGKWLALVGLLIIGLVWCVRRWGSKLVPWLGTDRGGVATALVCGFLVSLASTAITGVISTAAIVGAVEQAVIAVGGYVALKKLIWPSDAKA
jgi:hypothetical protein